MDTMAIPREADASWGVVHWLKNLSFSAATSQFVVIEKTVEQEESFPTKDVMRIVEISVANMDAGRLSEPVNERARQLLLLLGEDDDD